MGSSKTLNLLTNQEVTIAPHSFVRIRARGGGGGAGGAGLATMFFVGANSLNCVEVVEGAEDRVGLLK